MCNKNLFRSGYSLIFGILFLMTSCSTWHYKNPRVSIDMDQQVQNKPMKEHPNNPDVLLEADDAVYVSTITEENIAKEYSQVPGEMSIDAKKNNSLNEEVKSSNTIIGEKYSSFHKVKHKTYKVKHAEKTALSGWLRIMIILLAVGLVLLILGAIFSAVLFGGFWWFFYLIGSLCILAAAIVLLLGLLGVMS